MRENIRTTNFYLDKARKLLSKNQLCKVLIRNSQDLERPLYMCDVNALNLAISLASICDVCTMKASVVRYVKGSHERQNGRTIECVPMRWDKGACAFNRSNQREY